MLSRIPQWRQRLFDLAVVLVALLVVTHAGPKLPLSASGYVAAFLIWGAGLALMGHYKLGDPPALLSAAGKLLIDHAILSAVWMGALFLLGPKPALGGVLIFASVNFALLLLARVRFRRGNSSGSPRLPAAIMAADVLLCLVIFYAVNGLWWGLPVPNSLLISLGAGRALAQGVSLVIPRPALAWIVSQGLFVVFLLGTGNALRWPQTAVQLSLAAGLLPALVSGAHRWLRTQRPPSDPQEIWRRLALGAAAFALLHPLLSAQLMGAGDAKLYAEAMQDFLGQIKAGIFPVFVSQTEIAPYGSVFPFRMAFYHFHFGALLDLLTLRSLNVYAVQHLTLVLSAAGGAFGLYAVLKRLAPKLPWECAALASLYLGCPAWLSTLYGLDMYFTAMTLPWLPLVIYGIIRTFQPDCGWRSFLLLGTALAATWLAHPPVGFWTAVIVTVSQLLRLATAGRWPTRRDLGGLALAAGACLLLCAGLFVSLADVRIAGELVDPSAQVLTSLSSVIPQVFKPVSPAAERLSDLQLGYAWQALLLAGLLFRPRETRHTHLILLGLSLALLVLIYPVPGITPALWRALPWEVTNITNVWPMQRLYPIVVTLAAFIALGALHVTHTSRSAAWRLIFLGVLCLWTGFEAAKFVRRGHAYTKPPEATRVVSKVENSPLLSSWTAYTPQLPSRLLIGAVNDPRLLNRLLDPQTKAELVSNLRAASASPGATITAGAAYLDTGTMRVTPGFTLEPGRRYQLTLNFSDSDYAGSLQLLPLHDIHYRFFRELYLTVAKPSAPLALTVWTTEPAPVDVDLLFRPSHPADATPPRPRFFTSQLTPYRADDLPIKITSLAPYAARIETAQPAFLETHRFFARGYRATVNGRIVPVTESPEHLAMLPLAAGKNDIRLDYVGPPAVRAAFWISAISWIALAGFASWLVMQTRLARRAAPVQSTSF